MIGNIKLEGPDGAICGIAFPSGALEFTISFSDVRAAETLNVFIVFC